MNKQLLWFIDDAITLVHDAEGGIVYHPARLPPATADQWLATLRALVSWRSLRRPMYERVVDVPRLVASVALRDPGRPACIDAALALVQAVAPAPYTHVGLNLYRDGHDSVAPHGDRQAEAAEHGYDRLHLGTSHRGTGERGTGEGCVWRGAGRSGGLHGVTRP